jgi:fatty acid desaturase
MILHEDELALARAYEASVPLETLTREQLRLVIARGRMLHGWYKGHPRTHAAISFALLVSLVAADLAILLALPATMLPNGAESSVGRVLLAALVCGGLHSWLLYSLGGWSAHEGASHNLIFPGSHPAARALAAVAAQLCRVAGTVPGYYGDSHRRHHGRFGTEHDPEFLNFVAPRRFWVSLLPFAAVLNYNDFVSHRPTTYTRDRAVTGAVTLAFHGVCGFLMAQRFGVWMPVLAFALFLPHVGFFMDRLRQFSEHNLMPLDNNNGARSFGLGFWGMLVGGGPWGTPCHLEHHLVPSIPWYQQLILHRFVVSILTPEQKRQFLIEPVVGYPKLLWRLWREPNRFAAAN